MGAGVAKRTGGERDRDAPDGIAETHFRSGRLGTYRGLLPLGILAVLLVVALTGALGGAPNPVVRAGGDAAAIAVKAPHTLRNGTFFELAITIDARSAIAKPVIAISRSYLKDLTINTELPEPADMAFEDGAFTMTFPAMKAGERLAVKLDGQVNPPLIGRSRGTIALRDDKTAIAAIPVSLRILP
jgi:hypothetical protein